MRIVIPIRELTGSVEALPSEPLAQALLLAARGVYLPGPRTVAPATEKADPVRDEAQRRKK